MKRTALLVLLTGCCVCGSAQSFFASAFQPSNGDADYQRGLNELDARKWEAALADFDSVSRHNRLLADAALYWKAYALAHAGRQHDALTAIDQMKVSYPKSAWLRDAQALSIELRAQLGRPINPGLEIDGDVKVLALNSVMLKDAKKGLPGLIKVVNGNAPDQTKEQALFVLAQSDSPDARKALMQVATESTHPALQISAVRMMSMGATGSMDSLLNLYRSQTDEHIRRIILDELESRRDVNALTELAKDEKSGSMKAEILSRLATLRK